MDTGNSTSTQTKRRPNALYRVAAILAFIFFLGHTFGAIVSEPHFGPAASAVRSSMQQVVFPCNGANCSWLGFYLGFGIIVSVFLLFVSFLLWFLGSLPETIRVGMRPVTIALFGAFVALSIISKAYFFPMPVAFSVTISAVLGAIIVRFP